MYHFAILFLGHHQKIMALTSLLAFYGYIKHQVPLDHTSMKEEDDDDDDDDSITIMVMMMMMMMMVMMMMTILILFGSIS